MTTIQEFAEGRWRREFGSKPELDPLTEDDALMEAQVLDSQLDALRSRVAVLCELRLALQLREGNTGLLIANGVTAFEWEAAPRDTARTAWPDDKIMHSISDIATDPSLTWVQQTGRAGAAVTRGGAPVRYTVEGARDGTKIRAVLEPGGEGIITGFPIP